MEGQLLAMINELRQGELDFTINTYYPGPYDHEFSFEKLFEKPFAVFARARSPGGTRHFTDRAARSPLDDADAAR